MSLPTKQENASSFTPDFLKTLKRAYRECVMNTYATPPLLRRQPAQGDSEDIKPELLRYIQQNEHPTFFNMTHYTGALWLLSRFELTKEEGTQIARTVSRTVDSLTRGGFLVSVTIVLMYALLFIFGILVIAFEDFTLGAVVPPIVIGFVLWAIYYQPHSIQQRAITICLAFLGQQGALEAIPLLASQKYSHYEQTAQTSLFQLLPLLTPAHRGTLGREAVPNLCSVLENEMRYIGPNNLERITLLVEAFEKIGDSRAIPSVNSLKRELALSQKSFESLQLNTRTANWQRTVLEIGATPQVQEVINPYFDLQERVEGLLVLLEERRQQEEHHSTLLRGSSAPVEDGSKLLRPLTGRGEQEPNELLLRANENPHEE